VAGCVVGDVITVLGLVKVLATGDAKPAGTARLLARACHKLSSIACMEEASARCCNCPLMQSFATSIATC